MPTIIAVVIVWVAVVVPVAIAISFHEWLYNRKQQRINDQIRAQFENIVYAEEKHTLEQCRAIVDAFDDDIEFPSFLPCRWE